MVVGGTYSFLLRNLVLSVVLIFDCVGFMVAVISLLILLIVALLFLFDTFVFADCCLLMMTCMFDAWTMYFVVFDVVLVLLALVLGSFDLSVTLFEFVVLVFRLVVCVLSWFVVVFVVGFGLVVCSLCDGDFWFGFLLTLVCIVRLDGFVICGLGCDICFVWWCLVYV